MQQSSFSWSRPAQPERSWTGQQIAVFDWYSGTAPTAHRNLIVRARAGTGKTTTIKQSLRGAEERSMLLCAFNKAIAAELERDVPPGVRVQTLHSVGFAAVRRAWGSVDFNGDRGKMIARHVAGRLAPRPMVNMVAKLAGVGKKRLCVDAEGLVEVAWLHDCEPPPDWVKEGWTVEKIAALAVEAMQAAAQRSTAIDYDDMIWVPNARRLTPNQYELVVVDEAQDMAAGQLGLACASVREHGRICVVGDDKQAIYAFAGADRDALERTKTHLDAVEVPLTVTFRCPRRVVAAARSLVPDYEAAPGAPLGVVERAAAVEAPGMVEPGDFVLSRTNAGAVSFCLKLLQRGVRATVLGRDVGERIRSLVEGLGVETIRSLLIAVQEWAKAEREISEALERPERGQRATDMEDTISVLCEGLGSIYDLKRRLATLFDEDEAGAKGRAGRVSCATIHKAKGLEAPTVFVLCETFRRGGDEETNLQYVAMTRAIRRLVFVGQLGVFEGPFDAAGAL